MVRWEPDAPGRLAKAAQELFAEKGFDGTTAAEIAERAGLTERTFFRHFPDKREILFAGSDQMAELVVRSVAGTPPGTAPLDATVGALKAAGAVLQERGEHARRRQTVIDAHPELQERELIKMASWSTALAGALRERGVPDLAADLAAEAGVAVFRVAFARWIADPGGRELPQHMDQALDELRSVTSAG
jgi:AcrR family transcriptional regulator